MEQLISLLFWGCVTTTIPNPNQVNHLPKEQKELIQAYTAAKCKKRVIEQLNQAKAQDPNAPKKLPKGVENMGERL